jgi:hypothetical protein
MYAMLVVFSALAVFAALTGVAARVVLSVLAVLPVPSLESATVEDVCKQARLWMIGLGVWLWSSAAAQQRAVHGA